jgi:hypothetical protein
MSAVSPAVQIPQEPPVPRLLVELPSRPRVFFGNLRDLLLPRRLPPLELRSTPAKFWPDVFVRRSLPWYAFLESCAYHVIAMTLLLGLTHIFALRPRVELSRIRSFASRLLPAAEYLPPRHGARLC